jgi:hypothetical protein
VTRHGQFTVTPVFQPLLFHILRVGFITISRLSSAVFSAASVTMRAFSGVKYWEQGLDSHHKNNFNRLSIRSESKKLVVTSNQISEERSNGRSPNDRHTVHVESCWQNGRRARLHKAVGGPLLPRLPGL